MVKEKEKPETIEVCPGCGSRHIVRDYDRAELVCKDCGLVLDDNFIDQGAEWRAFDSEQNDKGARTGSARTFTLPDKGLTTEISRKNRDSYGKPIPTRNRSQIYRLRKWQNRIRVSNGAESSVSIALPELERLTSAMGLPRNVRETATLIYRKAAEKNLIRGRTVKGVVAASVYAACRQCAVPRTLDEVSDFSKIKNKEIGRTYWFMTRELKLMLQPTNPQDYIQRFCYKLSLSSNIENKATEIVDQMADMKFQINMNPKNVAASAIYLAAYYNGERRTIQEINNVTKTAANSIKEFTKYFDDNLSQFFPWANE